MPIYAYRCSECGFEKDYLQKMSDPPLTVCPSCGAEALRKQVTAAGFQLKGSGWYVTDFRNKDSGGKSSGAAGAGAKPGAEKGDQGNGQGASGGDAAPAKPAGDAGSSAAPAPAAGSGGSGASGSASAASAPASGTKH